jgi:hypothetical protein
MKALLVLKLIIFNCYILLSQQTYDKTLDLCFVHYENNNYFLENMNNNRLCSNIEG